VRDGDFEKQLHERLGAAERDKKNELKLAQAHAESERAKLLSELEQAKAETTSAVELAEAKLAAKLQDQLAEKAAEVEKLKASIQASEQSKQLAVIEATTRVEKERDRLKADLELAEAQKALGEKAMQEKYEQQIKDRDDAIERLRDMKAKLSTKMGGAGKRAPSARATTSSATTPARRRVGVLRLMAGPAPRSCRSCSR
jgi:hypothetical protein